MDLNDFERHIKDGKRCHLVGIGGVSMSALAEILHGRGAHITGSDINDGPIVEKLRSIGINVDVGHDAENIRGAGCVIRTAAAREDNVEIKAARDWDIPVFERAQAWGYIMRGYKNAVCIAGAHGKTTTTSMVSHILLAADTDPTIMIGGTLPVLESGCRVGRGDIIVLESCEYYNSFHNFHPTVAVILNVDASASLPRLSRMADILSATATTRTLWRLWPRSGESFLRSGLAKRYGYAA
jgi:UDP-N-acetylmuramate--alanine ligase